MSYETVKQQIKELEIEADRIYRCQQKIGAYLFELYHDGGIYDDTIKAKIAELIDEVKPNILWNL